jgi:deoxyribonuclease-4
MKFGAHMSIAGGISKALERGASINCEVVQIFVKNNMQWFGKKYTKSEIDAFFKNQELGKFYSVFGHAGYLINIATPVEQMKRKSIKALIQEIKLAESIKLPFLVLHPGSSLGESEETGINNAVDSLNNVIEETQDCRARIAIECTAGQGFCLGHKLEHIAKIYDGLNKPERLAVCLDTAHLFQAGYDISKPEVWSKVLKRLDELVGIEQVVAIHLNDSRTDLGSRIDRHAGIGKGKIGVKGFAHIVNERLFKDLPGCLETPKSADLHEDVENLRILRSLVGKT